MTSKAAANRVMGIRFHKDLDIASNMVSEDYIAAHIRKRPLYSRVPKRPPIPESPFGSFPPEYKRTDYFDGNIHDRLERVKPSKLPREVFKSRYKVKKVFLEEQVANNNNNNKHQPPHLTASNAWCDDARVKMALKCDSTGVLRARLNNTRPATAQAKLHTTSHASTMASTAGFSTALATTLSASTKGGGSRRPCVEEASQRHVEQRPKSAPASSQGQRAADAFKAAAITRVERYMKHQGRFAVPTSCLLTDFAESKYRKVMQRGIPRHDVPPKAGAYRVRPLKATLFRQYYERADLPVSMLHRAGGNRLKWHVQPADLDYHAYLPLFFDGLCEIDDPFRFIAMQGIVDMIEACPSKLLACIPQIILPLKTALDTRETSIMCGALKVLQHLILADGQIGQALVPYYRQLLPSFNLLKNKNDNLGDRMDFNQRRRLCLGDLISETLELMELTGGPDAFINIKYLIPTHQSCLLY